MIKYQSELINLINNFSELPHSILLIGDYGAGHNDVCSYISSRFNLDMYDITKMISNEYINEINQSSSKALYVVNMSNIGVREQNILLKLFEEPTEYTYIVLNCENEDLVLDTIKNRSYVLKFNYYSEEQLKEFISKDKSADEIELLLKVCSTPGQVEIANHTNISELFSLCEKMLTMMNNVNFQNMMSISNKINFKDEYDKFDLLLFLKTLKYKLLKVDIDNKIEICDIINNCFKYIFGMNNKCQYFENMLINMWILYNN